MATRKNKGLGLGLRKGRKSMELDGFVKAAEEGNAGVRPPKPAGKGIVWREKGWQRKMAVYLDPDLARKFELWCVQKGLNHSEAATMAFEMMLDEG